MSKSQDTATDKDTGCLRAPKHTCSAQAASGCPPPQHCQEGDSGYPWLCWVRARESSQPPIHCSLFQRPGPAQQEVPSAGTATLTQRLPESAAGLHCSQESKWHVVQQGHRPCDQQPQGWGGWNKAPCCPVTLGPCPVLRTLEKGARRMLF